MALPPDLQEAVEAARAASRQNPPIDAGTALQMELKNRSLEHAFDEDQVIEAAEAVGVPKDGIQSFLEQMASWL